MKKLYAQLLFIFLIFSTSCIEKHVPDPVPSRELKPVLKNARKIHFTVDASYDLSNSQAHSVLDSVSMSGDDKGLFVPARFESAAFFIDKTSGKVLAVVRTDTISDNFVVNAKTVTAALHDLFPSYLSLSQTNRKKFDATAHAIPEYNSLVFIVEKLLVNKEGVYSTNADFIEQLHKVNKIILEKYSDDNGHSGGKIKDVKEAEMSKWLKAEKVAQVENMVYSHVDAKFTPIHKDAGKPVVTVPIKPREIWYNDLRSDITFLSLKDGYYELNITQNTNRTKLENINELIKGVVGISIGVIFGMDGGSLTECKVALVGSVLSKVSSAAFTPPASWQEGAKLVLQTAMDAIITFGTSGECKSIFLNKAALTKILAQKALVVFAFIDNAKRVKDAAELGPWALGRWFGVDFSEDIQIYGGKIIPGCVRFQNIEGSVLKQYDLGEKARPAVEAKIISSYDEIDLGQFEATWIVTAGNGQVPPKTGFSHEGKTSTSWTLPLVVGTYKVTARLLDNEDEDMAGSPIEFSTRVTDIDSTEFYKAACIGKWTVTNVESGANNKLVLYETGGRYIVDGPNGNGRNGIDENGNSYYNITWRIVKSNGKYFLRESGFWHPAFEQYRTLDISLPKVYLTYPVSSFTTYALFPGKAPYASRVYKKN